jgi:hypothetical protein
MPFDGPCRQTYKHQMGEQRNERGVREVQGGSEYKVVTHQERIGFFSGNWLWETLLHSKRFIAGWVCSYGRKTLEHAHHLAFSSCAQCDCLYFVRRKVASGAVQLASPEYSPSSSAHDATTPSPCCEGW